MAKSTRSKVKRSFRAKKRTEGVYAATEAARLQRLHNKLKAITTTEDVDEEGDEMEEGARMETEGEAAEASAAAADGEPSAEPANDADAMDTDASKRISTHGPRNSRRESWRASKGLAPRPKANGMNRQGGVAARRKAGRSHRRR